MKFRTGVRQDICRFSEMFVIEAVEGGGAKGVSHPLHKGFEGKKLHRF